MASRAPPSGKKKKSSTGWPHTHRASCAMMPDSVGDSLGVAITPRSTSRRRWLAVMTTWSGRGPPPPIARCSELARWAVFTSVNSGGGLGGRGPCFGGATYGAFAFRKLRMALATRHTGGGGSRHAACRGPAAKRQRTRKRSATIRLTWRQLLVPPPDQAPVHRVARQQPAHPPPWPA